MRVFLSCTLTALVCYAASADDKKDDKIDAKKIGGKWEPKEKKKGKLLVRMAFTGDDKLTVVLDVDGKEKKYVGTYKVEGDKLSLAIHFEGFRLDSPQRIGKLTDSEMVWVYENDSDTFVRVKGK